MKKTVILIILLLFCFTGCSFVNMKEQIGADVTVGPLQPSSETATAIESSEEKSDNEYKIDEHTPNAHSMPFEYTYSSEQDLLEAIFSENSKGTPVYGLDKYFVAENTPDRCRFGFVRVREAYVAVQYEIEDENQTEDRPYYLIEWYRNLTADDLVSVINRMFKDPEEHVQMINELYVMKGKRAVDVMWAQDGLCFHAVLPQDVNEQQIIDFCNAKKIAVSGE